MSIIARLPSRFNIVTRIYLGLIILVLGFASCTDRDFSMRASQLSFSADTLIFDTVFTSIGTFTQRLKIYNDLSERVNIPTLRLAGGSGSPYKMIVNGQEGTLFEEVPLLPDDSLLVLVSATIDPMDQDLPFIVKDSIEVISGTENWDIDLVAWGQDAYFLSDSVLSCDITWAAGRPYVIYNSILVDSLCSLTIEPGVEIYSHPGSTIFVKGTLNAIGSPADRITFRNDRIDEGFQNAAGQWEGIYFLEGSSGNMLDYVDIRNSVIGIRAGTPDDNSDPDISIRRSSIENMSGYGILAFTSDLELENVLINNCQLGGFAGIAGGNYTLNHCTIANIPIDFLFAGAAVVLSDNVVLPGNQLLEADLVASMKNSVVWGFAQDELLLSANGNFIFDVTLENNFLKSDIDGLEVLNTVNEDPLFVDPQNYDYTPGENSPLIDFGIDLGIVTDLFGAPRSNPPDVGAVERQ